MKESDGAEQPTTGHLRRARLGRITLWKSCALIRQEKTMIRGATGCKNRCYKHDFFGLKKTPVIPVFASPEQEIGWRPAPEKNIETMPCWGKTSPENCLVDLGRDTRTSTQSRRLVRRKGASWSLNWPSEANFLAHLQLK
jgi:hypothetical protein